MNRNSRLVSKTPLARKTELSRTGKAKKKSAKKINPDKLTEKQRKAIRREYHELHLACGLCWAMEGRKGTGTLECHHIINQSRVDEVCNLLMLCKACHWHHTHGGNVDDQGQRWPKITVGMILTCKKEADPEQFDLERIAEIAHRAVTAFECEPIDQFYIDMRSANVPGY